jgi:hypothetical protein
MSKVANLSMTKYRVTWQSKQQVNGFIKKESVIVFGEDAAQFIVQEFAKDSPLVDIVPVFGDV